MGLAAYWQLLLYDEEDKEIDYTFGEGPECFEDVQDAAEYLRENPDLIIKAYRIEIIYRDGR